MEAETKKRMILSSSEVYLLIDSSKIGQDSLAKVCSTSKLTGLITDRLSNTMLQQFKDQNIPVLQSVPDMDTPAI